MIGITSAAKAWIEAELKLIRNSKAIGLIETTRFMGEPLDAQRCPASELLLGP